MCLPMDSNLWVRSTVIWIHVVGVGVGGASDCCSYLSSPSILRSSSTISSPYILFIYRFACPFVYLSIFLSSYIRANPLSSGYQFRLVSKFHMFGLLGHAWVPDISSIPLHRRHDFKLDRLTSMSWALSLVVKPPTWIGGNLDFQVSPYHHSRRVVQKHMFNHVQFFKSV